MGEDKGQARFILLTWRIVGRLSMKQFAGATVAWNSTPGAIL
jgi:hypothetical protein